jgi:hypothetical protein
MNAKRTNIAIQARGCFRHTNTMFPVVLHTPSKDSQASTLVITDSLNQKVEHSTIRWEDLSFPTDWVIDTPKMPIPRAITSAQIKETPDSAIISFPQHNLCSVSSSSKPTRPPPPIPSFCLHPSLQSLAGQIGQVPFAVKCLDCGDLITLSTLASFEKGSKVQFEHEHHNPRTHFPPPASTTKEQCPHPQCSDIPFPHDAHVLMIQSTLDMEIQTRQATYFPKDIKRPSSPEIHKFLRLSKGCSKQRQNPEWMKNMLNWDLYTHPKAKIFAKQTPDSEKLKLAADWKAFMDQRNMYISFHEWHISRPKSKPYLAPQKASLISCPVNTLSVSDLGKEISRIKKVRQQEQEKESLQVQHQQYHVLIELKIQDLEF